jgi:hypothetical protein
MSKLFSNFVLAFSLITFIPLANASLITNGSFEQTTFDDNSTSKGSIFNSDLQSYETKKRAWDIFQSIPGWTTTYGNGIELQKNVVTRSQNGQHHVELDSHKKGSSNAVMTQSLESLAIGSDYLLEFFYKPRTNQKNDNGINVYWYEAAVDFDITMKEVYAADSTKKETPKWAKQSVVFTATSSAMDLSFGSFGNQNTLGGLVDNVSLTSVPEPSVLSLFAIGLGMLFLRRRKSTNQK